MPLYDPPKPFLNRLRQYDPLLTVRWSDRLAQWVIERQVTRSKPVDPGLFRDHDEYLSARSGRTIILYAGREQLDNRVFFTLWYNDVQRRGGAPAVADEMDADYARRQARSRREFLDLVDQAARERYRYMNTVRVSDTGRDMSIVAGNQWT